MVAGNLKLTTTNFFLFRKLNKDMSRLTPSNAPIMHVKPVVQNLQNRIDATSSRQFLLVSLYTSMSITAQIYGN
jgi:hypothetical protein